MPVTDHVLKREGTKDPRAAWENLRSKDREKKELGEQILDNPKNKLSLWGPQIGELCLLPPRTLLLGS